MTLYTSQQFIAQIMTHLQCTDLPHDNLYKMVEALFDETHYPDLVPHIIVEPTSYRLQLHERGILIQERRTVQTKDVIYLVLEQVIHDSAYVMLLKKYSKDNITTHLKHTPEITGELMSIIHQAFKQIGGIYDEWHQARRFKELLNE